MRKWELIECRLHGLQAERVYYYEGGGGPPHQGVGAYSRNILRQWGTPQQAQKRRGTLGGYSPQIIPNTAAPDGWGEIMPSLVGMARERW